MTAAGERRVSGREHGKLRILADRFAWRCAYEAFQLDTDAGAALIRRAVDWPTYIADNEPRSFFVRRAGEHAGPCGWNTLVNSPTRAGALNLLDLGLNSIVAEYGDVIALAARIVSQCEANAWIAGEHRAWLADLIEAGSAMPYPLSPEAENWPHIRNATVFADSEHWRSHYDGWPAVVEMLRSDDRGIVVLDYSVTDGFPDQKWAAWPAEPGARFRERWRHATDGQHWRWSEAGLRRRTAEQAPLLRIGPDNLHVPRFATHEAWTWADLAETWRTHLATEGQPV